MKRRVFIENIRRDPRVLGTAEQRVCLGEIVEVLVFDSAPVERSRVEVFDQIADAIRAMNARLGLPGGLAALGVTRGLYDRIIDGAMADHCHKTNPRLATREDYVRVLDASM